MSSTGNADGPTSGVGSATVGSAPTSVVHARRLAVLTDRAVRVPFTRFEFGLDALLGLMPGAGDATGALLSAYIVVVASRSGVSGPTLLRMLGNIGLETLVGLVPLLGDLFDAGWKANVRNVALLDQHLAAPDDQRRASAILVGGVFGGLVLLGGFAVWSTLWILRWLGSVVVAVGGAAV